MSEPLGMVVAADPGSIPRSWEHANTLAGSLPLAERCGAMDPLYSLPHLFAEFRIC